jgi:enoyl-CoA hydratase
LIAKPDDIEVLLTEMEIDAGRPPMALHREQIDHHFSRASVEAVIGSLDTDPSTWAGEQLAALKTKSPQALKIAHRLLTEGRTRPRFADELLVEHRVALRAAASHDFREGVRALLVDKDGAPRWDPATLAEMTDARLDAFFAPLGGDREWTPLT